MVVPEGIVDEIRIKTLRVLWKKKKDKIKRTRMYQDFDKRGLRMTDVNLMFKALRLAWIPRLLTAGDQNWCVVPRHLFSKMGGLNFLLKCNYDTKYFTHLPTFHK